LSSLEGPSILSQDFPGRLGSGGKLTLDLPAASLQSGDYMIVVHGRSRTATDEAVESYSFYVVRGVGLR
jgi:hypothetical protein